MLHLFGNLMQSFFNIYMFAYNLALFSIEKKSANRRFYVFLDIETSAKSPNFKD